MNEIYEVVLEGIYRENLFSLLNTLSSGGLYLTKMELQGQEKY